MVINQVKSILRSLYYLGRSKCNINFRKTLICKHAVISRAISNLLENTVLKLQGVEKERIIYLKIQKKEGRQAKGTQNESGMNRNTQNINLNPKFSRITLNINGLNV